MAAKPNKNKKKRAPIPVRASRDAGDICALCGMCCDGTLFAWANLDAGEQDRAAGLGLAVGTKPDGEPGFEQPCPAFLDGRCGVYADRPHVCRSYRCRLLPEYESGRMTKSDCIDIIEAMRTLARIVEEQTGMGIGTYSSRGLGAHLQRDRPQDDVDAHQPLLVALDRFQRLAQDFFEWRPVPAEVAAAAAAAAAPAESG